MEAKYLEFSLFDYPGKYVDELRALPDDISTLGRLVRQSVVHVTTLKDGNVGTNKDLRFGDISKMPKFRQCDDDYLVTAGAMLSELFRTDPRGLVSDRDVTNKIVVTCRFVAILMSSILKSKGIPTRIRSGFAGYFDGCNGETWDHWLNEYWNGERWVMIDIDGSFSMDTSGLNPYDLPHENSFIFAHQAWKDLRNGGDPKKYQNAGGSYGLFPAAWELIYDFHSIMNRPITYLQTAKLIPVGLGDQWKEQEMQSDVKDKLDELALAMSNLDANREKIEALWQDSNLRLVKGSLL